MLHSKEAPVIVTPVLGELTQSEKITELSSAIEVAVWPNGLTHEHDECFEIKVSIDGGTSFSQQARCVSASATMPHQEP